MLLNRIMAWGSVFGALVLLGYATRLIMNNTPVTPTALARVMPPTQPGITQETAMRQGSSPADAPSPATSGQSVSHSTVGERPAGQRYIGGIGIVEPAGEAVLIGTQVPGWLRK